MPEIIDDKSEHCIPFILERLKLHEEQYESKGEKPPPFFLGLNGVQGAGKTTLVGQQPFCLCFMAVLSPLLKRCSNVSVFLTFLYPAASLVLLLLSILRSLWPIG